VGFLGLRTVVGGVEKLRTVLPLSDVIRDSAVQLVLLINVRVPEVVNVCVPVMVNRSVPLGACVRDLQQESGSIHRFPACTVHRLSPPYVLWVPARPLFGCGLRGLVGFEAVSLRVR
jgi:hypothetical protein